MKRTNIVIDEDILARGKCLTGIETTKELVDTALRELVRHRSQLRLRDLKGKVKWVGDLSEMRRRRTFP